ncbi:hypothetical protein [Acaryochloris thomasi]|uniref:hypothetical protein n=1 Tax=Acaryochloris thomasi TaxID=2929456 RepID=UPI000DA68E84|nr:hypothetical protein [Acaryochloris thomasi]
MFGGALGTPYGSPDFSQSLTAAAQHQNSLRIDLRKLGASQLEGHWIFPERSNLIIGLYG